MIPSIVARQVRETVLDYLRTTFALADEEFEHALFDFLNGEDGLFKGPYFDIGLPFRKASAGERIPLDIKPEFEPYKHQLKAFQRLYSKDGHQPQHTLVTTGTGSGKTECFLFPILDHCLRNHERLGVKAIILYPMNALASDQARRLAKMLWNDERLRGKVTAGLYVGGKGQHGTSDEEHLVDKRSVLRDSPPDVLLTNYKMLDFMLLRPDDRRLWQHNGPDTLRYLVLDELHTYDGAQGSDVACLIRRIKRRLECAPGSVCCVGTSATIGGSMKSETVLELTKFAGKVFDEDFFEDSVITEDRCNAAETLGSVVDLDRFPSPDDAESLSPKGFENADAWLRQQAELWLGEDAGALGPVAIGERLERHDFLRQLLKVFGGSIAEWRAIDDALLRRVPEWEHFEAPARELLLESFLGLVSHAKRSTLTKDGADRIEPFLTVQAQLWLRELRSLVRKVEAVDEPPTFAWADGGTPRSDDGLGSWLPIAHCRDCGAAGLASYQLVSDSRMQTELQTVGRSWLNRASTSRYIAFGHDEPTGEFPAYLCPRCMRVQIGAECDQCVRFDEIEEDPIKVKTIPIRISDECSEKTPKKFLARCPDCGSDKSLSMLGSRAPSLLSVAIGHLYQSEFNTDKKLLAFTDSVQDASHRAGFFGARTYRFNLRTAIQKVVDDAGEDGIALDTVGDRVWSYWGAEYDRPKLITTLLPSDLRELDTYVRFQEHGGAGSHPRLEEQLQDRLSWEATLEYGLNTRVGRTLENTRCSTISVDAEAISGVAEILGLELAENPILDQAPDNGFTKESLAHFLEGILYRLRHRGGIDHPMLRGYIKEGGNPYLLRKHKQPLMSPFGPQSVLPRFLTDRSRTPGEDPVFDTFVSRSKAPYTWYQDWASRSLGIDPTDSGMNQLYRETVRRLEDAGLLTSYELKRSGHAWGLSPGKLSATTSVGQVFCPECRRTVTIDAEAVDRWIGQSCTQYRCKGRYEPGRMREQSYYERIYRSGRLERIFSYEHTGLLTREEREKVEEEFKKGQDARPGAPNLFVCTPTLELGIDIGDLSAAMLCSVPPSTANYLQRVGRTGRTTGNAFCLTLANSRPHDLYFHAEPLEMMAGQVLPPGCFLDAPEMLQRQIVAHAMDAWARDEENATSLPKQVGFMLSDAKRKEFPGRFIEFYRKHRERLAEEFIETFDSHLTPPNRDRLKEFALGEEVPNRFVGAFNRIETELKDFRNMTERVKKRVQDVENDPDSVEDPDAEKKDLEDTRKALNRLMAELRNKYPLNVLTDEGVLPNYAFPEPGVRLESVVSHRKGDGQWEYTARDYIRPASTAIRELAPFNTFYADGRKVKIDEIDIGSKARPLLETWRLCQECSYMRIEVGGQQPESECPRCRDRNWSDQGQVRTLIHFRRSRSLATRLDSSTVDDTDDREAKFYETLDLIDVAKEHYHGAKLIEDIPFGYELLKDLTLREVNFGLDSRTPQHGFKVCGTPIGDKGFEVCLECGRVRAENGKINHSAACKARKTGIKEQTGAIFLYREVSSEAIRVLLPVSSFGLDTARASFKAALQLGFRRHFQGDPGHLIIRSVREPIGGGAGDRQFLVIFDGVPGGTGYLSELWQKEHFLDVLQKALDALQACSCQQDPERDGCYRCLFAYQSQRDLPLVSNREAQGILRDILGRREELKTVSTLSDVTLEDKIESELEQKFLAALRARAEKTKGWSWEEKIVGGEHRWILRSPRMTWEIRAQYELGASQGVLPSSRADFLIRSASGDPAIKPIAVFCDGLAYHVLPDKERGRIWDDIQKRTGVLQSGGFVVWSVSWKDVVEFEDNKGKSSTDVVLKGLNMSRVGQMAQAVGLTMDRATGQMGSMEMLLAYLTEHDAEQWEKLAQVYASIWLLSVSQWISPQAGSAVESRLESEAELFKPGPLAQVGSDADVLTRAEWLGWLAILGRSTRKALSTGHVERVVLRLFDEKAAREDSAFEGSWRAFLQVWNLLQFHDGLDVTSSELITGPSYGAPVVHEARVAETGQVTAVQPEDEQLSRLLEVSTEHSRPLILSVAEADLPLPAEDFELSADGKAVGCEAEIAWPEQKIAVLAGAQIEDTEAFEKAGWTVLEAPVAPELLLETLRGSISA